MKKSNSEKKYTDYFHNYHSQQGGGAEEAYRNLIQQNTPLDDIASGINQTADDVQGYGQNVLNTKAVLRGAATGMKAASDFAKNAKTKWLEEQIQSMLHEKIKADKAYYDEINTQKALANFAVTNATALQEISQDFKTGNIEKSHYRIEELARNLSEIEGLGFEGMRYVGSMPNGIMNFEDREGEIVPVRYGDFVRTLDQKSGGLFNVLGRGADKVLNYLPDYERQIQQRDMIEQEQMNQLQGQTRLQNAQINKEYAIANEHALKARQLGAGTNINPKVQAANIKHNMEYVKDLRTEINNTENLIRGYEKIIPLIQKNKHLIGSHAVKQVARLANQYLTGTNKAETLIEMEKGNFLPGLKDIFSGATSDRDIDLYMKTLIGVDKNPQASIQRGTEELKRLRILRKKQELERDIYSQYSDRNVKELNELVKQELESDETQSIKAGPMSYRVMPNEVKGGNAPTNNAMPNEVKGSNQKQLTPEEEDAFYDNLK